MERDVVLREERVVVERRKPTPGTTATAAQGVLTEASLEMSDSYEVAEVWKSVRVAEEVVLRREVTERHETVRDTVRRDEVAVEHAPRIEAKAPRQVIASRDVAPHVLRPDEDTAPHGKRPRGIIANPNCSTMQMLVALAPYSRNRSALKMFMMPGDAGSW